MSKALLKSNKNQFRRMSIAVLTALSLPWSLISYAQQNENSSVNSDTVGQPAERWFEIEVILLEQLMDKTRFNEDFSVENAQPQSAKSLDLINTHLQGLLAYQQQLKTCQTNTRKTGATQSSELSVQLNDSVKQLDCNNHINNLFTDPVAEQIYQIPRRISGNEDLYAEQPYLLNENSLQLTHITKSLRKSKTFRPLLHVGWRQAVVARNSAIPVKLMAGSNLVLQRHVDDQADAQQALNDDMISLTTEIEKNIDNELLIDDSLNDANDEENSMAKHNTTIVNGHIETIISQLENNDISLEHVLADIKKGDALPLLQQQEQQQDNIKQQSKSQPWFISGLFNVHLDHYLFINSQFTVLSEQTNDDSSTTELLIPFKQNRRVISGELHYFDHPYMGMIVQIRRHERPEPIVEVDETIDSIELATKN